MIEIAISKDVLLRICPRDKPPVCIVADDARIYLTFQELVDIGAAVAGHLESAAEAAGHSDIGGPACAGVWDGTMWDDAG